MSTPTAADDIPAGSIITPQYVATSGGPVKVKCTNGQSIITSQRTLYKGHFEEVPGAPPNSLAPSMWFTWYDTQSMSSWIVLANTTNQNSTADIYLAGTKLNTQAISVPAGSSLPLLYANKMTGPVEVRVISGPNLLVSQKSDI